MSVFTDIHFMFEKNRHCLPSVMQPLECSSLTLCHCFERFDSMGFFGFLLTFFTTFLVVCISDCVSLKLHVLKPSWQQNSV